MGIASENGKLSFNSGLRYFYFILREYIWWNIVFLIGTCKGIYDFENKEILSRDSESGNGSS